MASPPMPGATPPAERGWSSRMSRFAHVTYEEELSRAAEEGPAATAQVEGKWRRRLRRLILDDEEDPGVAESTRHGEAVPPGRAKMVRRANAGGQALVAQSRSAEGSPDVGNGSRAGHH